MSVAVSMNTQTENYQLDNSLTLFPPSSTSITVRAIALTLTQQHNTLIEAILTFEVTPLIYQRIDNEGLFELLPELCACPDFKEFLPNANIEIEARLKPNWLPNLTPHLNNIPAYFNSLNSWQPDNPLLSTSSWLAKQVKQEETGYRTFWDYLATDAITSDRIEPEKINEAITNFIIDSTAANLQFLSEEAIDRAINEVTEQLENLLDPSLFEFNEASLSPALEEIAKTLGLASSRQFEPSQTQNTSPPILQTIANFFTAENWFFVRIQDEQILQIAVNGQNGKLTCYAQAIEEQSLFIFYSICPIPAPESQRQALAEFLTQVNYDLIIGNFQLDLTSGQIRYKTSLDVSDSTLSTTQIKNLIYTNITMMDSHLPEILSVINNSSTAWDVIPFKENLTSANFNGKNGFNKSKQIAVTQEDNQLLDFSQTTPQLERQNNPLSLSDQPPSDIEYNPQLETTLDRDQELDDSQTLPQLDRENTSSSLSDQPPSDIESDRQIETTQESDQELDNSQKLFQIIQENTALYLPPRPLENVENNQQIETAQESDRELDNSQTLPQLDGENTPLSLPDQPLEDVEDSQQAETTQEKDRELDYSQTVPQLNRENTPLSLLHKPLEDVEDSQQAETAQEKERELDYSQTVPQLARENTPLSLPEDRASDVEYSQQIETTQEEKQELDNSQIIPKIELENTPLSWDTERPEYIEDRQQVETPQEKNQQLQDTQTLLNPVCDVARTPSQPPQNNPLTILTEQPDPTKQPEKISLQTDVLSDLTEEEIASFESAMQLVKAGKLNTAKTILTQLKNNLSGELGEEGEQIFYAANNIFLMTNLSPARINELNGYDKILPPNVQNIIPALINPNLESNSIKIDCEFAADGLVSKIYLQVGTQTVAKELKSYFGTLKQIYRYWDISSNLKPLLQRIKSISKEQLKQSVPATRETLRSVQRLPACIQQRLFQLATEKLESHLEVDILIEIGELKELLAKTKRILDMEFP